MQPQDYTQPTNQPQDDTQSSATGAPIAQPLDPANPLSAGMTIQPQAGGVASNTPTWHNDATNDANQLYAQTEPSVPNNPGSTQPAAAMPPNPLHDEANAAQNPADAANPAQAMANDFGTNNLVAPASATSPSVEQPPAGTAPVSPQEPLATQSEPVPVAPAGVSQETASQPTEPTPPNLNQAMHDPYAPAPTTAQQGVSPQLPGSESLGTAVASLYQPDSPQGQPGMPSQMGNMPAANYGPPPKKGKAVIFIIIGVIIGLAAIAGGVFFFLRNRTVTNTQPTPTPATTTPPTSTSTPTSGPATPPAGYVTITKQCYTFALYNPNTVPTDQSCSFADATFGKLKTSKIYVQTTTESYKTIDDYLAVFEPTVTVIEKKDVSLDGQTAKQVIYKASDGRTYSQVAVLIVSKNYQQGGKAVTGLALNTSYQESFDKEVTENVISTWRWQ